LNNNAIKGDDTGLLEVSGDFVTLNGRKYTTRYHFVLLQQAIDGSSVVTFWPDIGLAKVNANPDSLYWTRRAKR